MNSIRSKLLANKARRSINRAGSVLSVCSNTSSVDPTRRPVDWKEFDAAACIFSPNIRGKANAHLFVKEFGNSNALGRRYALQRGKYYHCMTCKRNGKAKRAIPKDGKIYVLENHDCPGVAIKENERESALARQLLAADDDDGMETDIRDPHKPAPNAQQLKIHKKSDIKNSIFSTDGTLESEADIATCATIIFESMIIYTDRNGIRKYKEMASRIALKMSAKFGGTWCCGASDHQFFLSASLYYVNVGLDDLFVQIVKNDL